MEVQKEVLESTEENEKRMDYSIYTMNDCGSGMEFHTKKDFLEEIGLMIDDCFKNGGTYFSISVDSDASCFYIDEEDNEDGEE